MKTNRKIIFRADGTHQIGMGHFTRTLALAEMLNQHFQCVYATRNPSPYQIAEIGRVCSGRIDLAGDDLHFDLFLDHLQGDEIVVLDNYFFTTKYQQVIKSKGCTLVCIDDLHDRRFVADVVINYTPGIEAAEYEAGSTTRLALGPEYALLRPEFLFQAARERSIGKIENVMICFGGSDSMRLTENCLKAVQRIDAFKSILVVTGSAHRSSPELQAMIRRDPRVSHRRNLSSEEMLETMLEAELMIVPASGVAFEGVCAGSQLLVCRYADNQKIFYRFLTEELDTPSFGDNSAIFQEKALMAELEKTAVNSQVNKLQRFRESIAQSRSNILKLFLTLNDS